MKLPPLLLLIPYSKGVYVYAQTTTKSLHHVLDTPEPREIFERLQPIPPLVALLGETPWLALYEQLLEHTDLCLVPDPWLKHIPPQRPRHRANFALQLLEAYFEDPIRLIGTKSTLNCPLAERVYS